MMLKDLDVDSKDNLSFYDNHFMTKFYICGRIVL